MYSFDLEKINKSAKNTVTHKLVFLHFDQNIYLIDVLFSMQKFPQ